MEEAEAGDIAIIETMDLEKSKKDKIVWEREIVEISNKDNLDYFNKTNRYKNNEYYRIVKIIKVKQNQQLQKKLDEIKEYIKKETKNQKENIKISKSEENKQFCIGIQIGLKKINNMIEREGVE